MGFIDHLVVSMPDPVFKLLATVALACLVCVAVIISDGVEWGLKRLFRRPLPERLPLAARLWIRYRSRNLRPDQIWDPEEMPSWPTEEAE